MRKTTLLGTVALSVLAFALSACSTKPDEKVKAAGIEAVKENLKDPYSAVFDNILIRKSKEQTYYVCGTVNAKNSYGAYVGKKYFITVVGLIGDGYKGIDSGLRFSSLPKLCLEDGPDVKLNPQEEKASTKDTSESSPNNLEKNAPPSEAAGSPKDSGRTVHEPGQAAKDAAAAAGAAAAAAREAAQYAPAPVAPRRDGPRNYYYGKSAAPAGQAAIDAARAAASAAAAAKEAVGLYDRAPSAPAPEIPRK